MNPLDLAIVFLGLGITEAVIKPLAKRFVQLSPSCVLLLNKYPQDLALL